MKFLKQCSPAEYQEQVRRATEEENERYQEREGKAEEIKAHRIAASRDAARLRQRRHREKKYESEIALGERTPRGTKRTQVCGASLACISISHETIETNELGRRTSKAPKA